MAPYFFIPEGIGSGTCRDSALDGTGQVMAVGRAFCPHGDGSLLSCPVPHRSFHAILGQK